MEEVLKTVFLALLFVLYVLLIPVIMLVATPVILLWPANRGPGGKRGKRDIRGRYRKLWKIWENLGIGLPTS
jgi:hypothetical protein